VANINPKESFEELKAKVTESVSSYFPHEGSKHVIELENILVKDEKLGSAFRDQKKAKMNNRTWGVPVQGVFALKDKETGKVISKDTVKIATIPKITDRYSYIVDGTEYQVENLWRLKPGVYTRTKANGELESHFNVKGRGFHVNFDPKSRAFKVRHGGAQPPLYPVMKALGVSDESLEKEWGKEIFTANKLKQADVEKKAIQFAQRLDKYAEINDYADASALIKTKFKEMEMNPSATERTLGKGFKSITPESVVMTSSKLLNVARGKDKPDDRDSLMFKELLSIEDLMGERIRDQAVTVKRRINNNIDRKRSVKSILSPDIFGRPVTSFFAKTSLSNPPDQINPLEMIIGQQKTTIMGEEGGIKSAHRITEEAKLVNASHMGVLDPLHTPENDKTGVTLHLAIGAKKTPQGVTLPLYDLKKNKMVRVSPEEAFESIVALPDEVKWENGKPILPKSGKISASLKGNEIGQTSVENARYALKNPAQLFTFGSNLVPFLQNNSANRATMAGRQMEQAISLKHREVPLVQAKWNEKKTFDELMGNLSAIRAQQDGKVTKVTKDLIQIKDTRGKLHDIDLYDNYPLNDKKSFMNSEPLVKVGDEVKAKQPIADTNFSRGGVYAPGVNLTTAYVPYKGLNYEDGIVISESAANKLTSEHLYKKALSSREGFGSTKNKYEAYFPDRMTKEQSSKLDTEGVIKPGMTVMPGDTIVTGLAEQQLTTEQQKLKMMHKSLVKPYKDKAITWDEDKPGEVVEVHKGKTGVTVHIKTNEPAEIGDKIVARHANKGIITAIIPDKEMPQTPDGKPVDTLMNPITVPGRINLGQVLETAAGKLAKSQGTIYKVQNFSGEDHLTKIKNELTAAGLSDTETLTDPVTGKKIKDVFVGTQYTLKLQHQVGKKMSARSRDAYDRNLIPRGGGPHGAQSLGALGTYAMLAHGATENLREFQTIKSDRSQGGDNDELWAAIQAGEKLPPPRPTFAYKKFLGYMNAMGVNVEKDGNSLNLMPLTDKQVLGMSNGEIKDGGRMVKTKNLEPERGGLFDPDATGGLGGTKWSHIKLKEPMPNPLFQKAIMSVSGIRGPEFDAILGGSKGVAPTGEIVGMDHNKALYGPAAFNRLLDKIDVGKELAEEEKRVGSLTGQNLNESNKRIKYLRALNKLEMKPTEAYMMKNVPVLPPAMRPLSVMDDGSLNFDDVNQIYKHVSLTNQKLGQVHRLAPEEEKNPLRVELYDNLKGLTGLGGTLNKQYPGILDTISGTSPKVGYVQDKLVKRKQDLSMRSTIIPDPSLSIDEVGLPRKAAMEMFKPFVVRELRRVGGMSPLAAQKAIKDDNEIAHKALENVVKDRPVILKRDPVLHKYGIQAFQPKLTTGRAIQIHPLVTGGYNADFDGDAMAAFVPVSNEAVREARNMMPSKLLFNPSTYDVMYAPGKEMQVGLYLMSEKGKKVDKTFADKAELEKAYNKGEIGMTDVVKVGGMQTTLGRVRIDSALPRSLQGGPILKNLSMELDKGAQKQLFQNMAKVDPKAYPKAVDAMKNFGNEYAYESGFSFGLKDFEVHKDVRDAVFKEADRKVSGLDLSKPKDAEKFVDTYHSAMKKMRNELKRREDIDMYKTRLTKLDKAAGVKGDGLLQITGAPVLFVDSKGDVVLSPVKRSYSEGLKVADYWANVAGGRKGIVQKVQSVRDPGYLSKLMINSTMNQVVDTDDCGTNRGVRLSTTESDIVGRYTAADTKIGKTTIPTNTLIDTEVLDRMKNAKINKVVVRSPMRCNHHNGLCAKCYGLNENGQLHDKGTNIGVLAAQALGEPGTQMAMKSFHCNHAKSLVRVCPGRGMAPITTSLEDLFHLVESEVEFDELGEFKRLTKEDGWLIESDKWTLLTMVRRHKPSRPMVIISDGSAVTICQDNHPVAYRPNLVQCECCGYHRLKKPGKNASIKNGKWYCPKCGRYQFPPEKFIGDSIQFEKAGELEPKRVYLERRFPEQFFSSNNLEIDPYVAGMYVAEGSISYRWTNPNNKVKKPYSFTISQKAGHIRSKLEERLPKEWGAKLGERRIEVDSLELGMFMEETFGRHSRNVSLPPTFLSYANEWLADFLSGLIDGDGSQKQDVDGADRIAIDTTSFELAQQVVMICAKLNIVSNLHTTKVRELTRHQGFRVVLRVTKHAKNLLKESIKVSTIAKLSPDQYCELSGPHIMTSKKSILYTNKYVYDVSTESGTFVAGGLLNHNSGGIYEGKSETAIAGAGLDRAKTMLRMPKIVKGSAVLSTATGRVTNIRKDPAGGYNVTIGSAQHYVPYDRQIMPKLRAGTKVRKGDPITLGPINPHEMLPLTGINRVQGQLASELHSVYGEQGVRRRNSEVVVRALSNITKIEDPGDNPDFVKGDLAPTTVVQHWNSTSKNSKPVVHQPIMRGVQQVPLDMQEDWLARLNHERLSETIVEGAQRGWSSDIHGTHPIPPLIYSAEFGKKKPY